MAKKSEWQTESERKAELEKRLVKKIRNIAIGVGIVLIALFIFNAVIIKVPAGHVGVLFDKVSGGVQMNEFNGGNEGWGFKIPFIQSVNMMDVRTQSMEYMAEKAVVPKDVNGINFKWDMVVRYKLDPTMAAEVYKTKGELYADKIIGTALRSRAREVLGNYAQEKVQQERIKVANEIKVAVQARVNEEASSIDYLKPGFLVIESIDLRDLNYDPQIEQSIIKKQTQLQVAEQKVYELQQAQKEKEIIETKAEAQKNKQILEAEGRAEAILLEATAKAEGIQKINYAYQDMPPEYVSVKYAEALKEIAAGNNGVFMDLSRFGSANGDAAQIGLLQYDKLIPTIASTEE